MVDLMLAGDEKRVRTKGVIASIRSHRMAPEKVTVTAGQTATINLELR